MSVKALIPNLKILIYPLAALAVIATLLLVLGTQGAKRTVILVKEMQEEEKKGQALNDKLAILRKVETGILDRVDKSLVALPEKNSSLEVFTLVRGDSQTANSQVTGISFSNTGVEGEMNKASLKIDIASPDLATLASLFRKLSNYAPVTTLEKLTVEFEAENNSYLGKGEAGTYWAPLPAKISGLTESIAELSGPEADLLSKVSALRSSEFVLLNPTEVSQRPNPFE